MTKQVDTSRGCTGCTPYIALIICLAIVIGLFVYSLGGNK